MNVTLKGDVHKASEPFRKLVLEDDRLVQYQNKDVFYRVEAYYKQGEPTIKLRLQSLFLTLVGLIFINFMILVASLSFHDSDPNDLSYLFLNIRFNSGCLFSLFLNMDFHHTGCQMY